MEEIPCIRDFCLKYPICRNRMSITCDVLESHFMYLIKLHNSHNSPEAYDDSFVELIKTLPNLFKIHGNDMTFIETTQLGDVFREA